MVAFIGLKNRSSIPWHIGTDLSHVKGLLKSENIIYVQADGDELEHIRDLVYNTSLLFDESTKDKQIVKWTGWKAQAIFEHLARESFFTATTDLAVLRETFEVLTKINPHEMFQLVSMLHELTPEAFDKLYAAVMKQLMHSDYAEQLKGNK